MRRCHNGWLTYVSNERVASIIEGEVDKEGRALGMKEIRSFDAGKHPKTQRHMREERNGDLNR